MPLDIKLARARCEAATPEPWLISSSFLVVMPDAKVIAQTSLPTIGLGLKDAAANTLHIAHARTDLPAALDRIEVADRLIQAYRTLFDADNKAPKVATDKWFEWHSTACDALDAAEAAYKEIADA